MSLAKQALFSACFVKVIFAALLLVFVSRWWKYIFILSTDYPQYKTCEVQGRLYSVNYKHHFEYAVHSRLQSAVYLCLPAGGP